MNRPTLGSVQRKTRAITAHSLKERNATSISIRKHVGDILVAFDQNIDESAKNMKASCKLKLPHIFDVPNMTNSVAQLYIYNYVIADLEDRGFRVEIDDETNVWEVTGWDIKENDELNQEMVMALAAHMKSAKKATKRPDKNGR